VQGFANDRLGQAVERILTKTGTPAEELAAAQADCQAELESLWQNRAKGGGYAPCHSDVRRNLGVQGQGVRAAARVLAPLGMTRVMRVV
jgi:hypothetical protein